VRFSVPAKGSGPLEPVSVPVAEQDHIVWLRLLPVNMSTKNIEAVLHRSHHAMVPLPSSGRGCAVSTSIPDHDLGVSDLEGHLYLIWGGFSSDMTVLDDLWLLKIYSADVCMRLEPQASWENASRCWTAWPVHQHNAPLGRAYSKLVVVEVSSPDWMLLMHMRVMQQCCMAVDRSCVKA
jgi:hypothetical protein